MTRLTTFLRIRVSRDQYERIVNNSHAKNYKTVSQYIRDSALGKGLLAENILSETNRTVKEILEILKEKNQPK